MAVSGLKRAPVGPRRELGTCHDPELAMPQKPKSRKGAMLLLFGLKTVLRALPARKATCRNCGRHVEHYLEERASKFTLFFIPVFTTSRTYRIACSSCGQRSSLSRRGMKALAQ
ncbi:zinc-ribbon domain-containing protein [Arthrobacter sp. NPDC093128]|uniref:zinc-ribbon domain-containing protein n=1 Tax=Arthrobacter sp. NPDC093128 TaxID=3154979 RepID=UPI00342FDBE1